MKRPLFALGLLFVACAASPDVTLESGPAAPLNGRIGLLVGPARRRVVADWDSLSVGKPDEPERAYCVASYTQLNVAGNESDTLHVDIVTDLIAPVVQRATPWSIRFNCPTDATGRAMPTVHTHPPSVCNTATGDCLPDSSRMTVPTCLPSTKDVASVDSSKAPFGVVVCARDVWRFFGPSR